MQVQYFSRNVVCLLQALQDMNMLRHVLRVNSTQVSPLAFGKEEGDDLVKLSLHAAGFRYT